GPLRTRGPAGLPVPGPRGATAAVVAAALAVAALLGAFVARDPGLFHIGLSTDPAVWGALAAGLAAALWLIRRPEAALVVLGAFVYLNLSEVLVRQHGLPSLLQLLVLPVAVAALLDRPLRETAAVAFQGPTLLVAAWVLTQLASTTWAWDPAHATEVVAESVKAFVLFLVLALLARTPRRVRLLCWTAVASGCLLAAFGAYQVATGDFDARFGGLARIKDAHIYGDEFEPRIAGPLGDPNFFAQILLVLVPIALALAAGAPGAGRAGLARRGVALGAAGLLVAGTVLTYSRGGALALAVVLGLSLAARGVRGREIAGALVVLVLVWVVLPAGFTRRLTTLEQLSGGGEAALHPDSSFEKRKLVTASAWRMFLDHPVLGVGAGNYTTRFGPYAERVGSPAREYDEPFGPNYPHNLYLEVGAETGLVGLALFGAALAALLAGLETARRRLVLAHAAEAGGGGRTPRAWGDFGSSAALARGVQIALVGYLVSSLFLHGQFQRYLWVLFALAVAFGDLGRRAAARGEVPAGEPEPGAGAGAGARTEGHTEVEAP
ncbi:MAG: O-antigen ligase family protein, partial [Thermoanaerobaculia bacterium]